MRREIVGLLRRLHFPTRADGNVISGDDVLNVGWDGGVGSDPVLFHHSDQICFAQVRRRARVTGAQTDIVELDFGFFGRTLRQRGWQGAIVAWAPEDRREPFHFHYTARYRKLFAMQIDRNCGLAILAVASNRGKEMATDILVDFPCISAADIVRRCFAHWRDRRMISGVMAAFRARKTVVEKRLGERAPHPIP